MSDINFTFGGYSIQSMDEYLNNDSHAQVKLSSDVWNPYPGTKMMDLTDKGRAKIIAEHTGLPAGTRVAFRSNIGTVLLYTNLPPKNCHGTVVTVKTSSGNVTEMNGEVFVKFDDGRLRSIRPEHLRKLKPARVAGFQQVANSIDDFVGFTRISGLADDELVHKATKDIWSLSKTGDGYVLSRLFDSDGEPLKV